MFEYVHRNRAEIEKLIRLHLKGKFKGRERERERKKKDRNCENVDF